MNTSTIKYIGASLTVLLAAVVLLWSLGSGYKNGKQLAQSDLALKNATALAEGLEFFYNDLTRYPSATEFSNSNVMLSYYSAFPPVEVLSQGCPNIFTYKRPLSQSYELDVCFPKAFSGFGEGWNKIVKNR